MGFISVILTPLKYFLLDCRTIDNISNNFFFNFIDFKKIIRPPIPNIIFHGVGGFNFDFLTWEHL